MSTAMILMAKLLRAGSIQAITTELGYREHVMRQLYATARFIRWVERDMPKAEGSPGVYAEPIPQQLDNLIHDFIVGEKLEFDRQFHVMRPAKKAIWELKTPELRLFGWFPDVDCFVVDAIALKSTLRRGLADGYVSQTAETRTKLGFTDGLYINSGEPRDVVSNYD